MHKYKVDDNKRIKDFPSAERVENPRGVENLGRDDIEIVSSTDQEFAIPDKVGKHLRETKKSLRICCPWISKIFVDKIRILPKGCTIEFLTRPPDEKDFRDNVWANNNVRAIESLERVANENSYTLSVMCDPYKHGKMIIFDNSIAMDGSFNPTPSSMYYKHEILHVWKNPIHVNRFIEIFNQWWNSPHNTTWEKIQIYHGYKSRGAHHSIHKRIAEAIEVFLRARAKSHYENTRKYDACAEEVLIGKIVRRGFNRKDVVEVINKLIGEGFLFRPESNYIQLVCMQEKLC